MRAFIPLRFSLYMLGALLSLSFEAEARFCWSPPFTLPSSGPDRYAYKYRQKCYYPYYNSGYWKSAAVLRLRPRPIYEIPQYYPAWGYPKY